MSDAAQVEVGRCGDVPTCPDNIARGLKEYDSRLRCRFNPRHRCWEIQEFLRNRGTYSHVLFWHDGPWNAKVYRPLPFTAEPIVMELRRIAMGQHGDNIGEYVERLQQEGEHRRAKDMIALRALRAEKLRALWRWQNNRHAALVRAVQRGGASAKAAVQERQDVMRDLGFSGS